jgi:hypothetical protein
VCVWIWGTRQTTNLLQMRGGFAIREHGGEDFLCKKKVSVFQAMCVSNYGRTIG